MGKKMKSNKRTPNKTIIAASVVMTFQYSAYADSVPTDASGKPTATAATTGHNFASPSLVNNTNPYFVKGTNGYYTFQSNLNLEGDMKTIASYEDIRRGNYIYGEQAYNSKISINLNNIGPLILEGNNVSADSALYGATLNSNGAQQKTLLYQNFANFIHLENSSNSLLIVDSNTANDATILNDSASLYLNANSAQKANITARNNGLVYLSNNAAEDTIVNTTGSQITFLQNKADGVTINSDNSSVGFSKNSAEHATIHLTNKSIAGFGENSAINYLNLNNDNSTSYFFSNTARQSTINNTNNANFLSMSNDISDSTLYNDSTSTVYIISLDHTDSHSKTLASNISFVNDGTTYLEDRIVFASSYFKNNKQLLIGTMYGGTNITGGTVDNYGTIQTGNDVIINGTTVNNYGIVTIGNNFNYTGNFNQNGVLIFAATKDNTATINSNLINNGSIILNPTPHSAGNTLIINGNYSGNGTLSIGTKIGESNSATDKIIITGDFSGTSKLYVNNENGIGTKNTSYTKLIEVQGQSSGIFTQAGRIIAGSYEYYIDKIGSDWYLTNIRPSISNYLYRPGIGGYIANKMYGNTLFNIRFADHNQEHYYKDPLTGEIKKTSMWLRQSYANSHFNVDKTTVNTHTTYNATQVGGNLFEGTTNQKNRFIIGTMAGYGYINGHSTTGSTGNTASHSADGYSIGIYGTWMSDVQPNRGAYVDSWLQYNYFRSHVTENTLSADKYNMKGLTASLEAGYTFGVGSDCSAACLYIQPQAQMSWLGVQLQNHNDINSGSITDPDDGQLQTRVGTRLFLDNDVGDKAIKPYIEASYIHTPKNYNVTFGKDTQGINNIKKLTEIKLGVEGYVSQNLKLWGNIAQQSGDNDFRNRQIMLGVHYAY